jgi:hypothetical protein
VTGGGVTLKGFYALGIAAATSQVTIPTGGTAAGADYLGGWFQELQNCASAIGGTGTTSFTADGASHSLTLSAAPTIGDAALGYFIDTSSPDFLPLESSAVAVGAGFTALSNQTTFGKLSEINTSTASSSVGAIYPNSGHTVLGIGVVVKQGSLGTGPPPGMYVDHYQVEQFPHATSEALTFPFGGNLIVGMASSEATAGTVTSITDAACSWSTGAAATSPYTSQIFYGSNCSPSSTNKLTVTFSGTPQSPGTALALMSVTGASASPFDKSVIVNDGNQTVAANLSTVSLTPSSLNELTVSLTSIAWHSFTGTVTDANGHEPTFLASVNTKLDDAFPNCPAATVPSTLDEDNGWGYYINRSDTTAITFLYAGTQTTGGCATNPSGVGGFNSVAVAFKPAP